MIWNGKESFQRMIRREFNKTNGSHKLWREIEKRATFLNNLYSFGTHSPRSSVDLNALMSKNSSCFRFPIRDRNMQTIKKQTCCWLVTISTLVDHQTFCRAQMIDTVMRPFVRGRQRTVGNCADSKERWCRLPNQGKAEKASRFLLCSSRKLLVVRFLYKCLEML